MKTKILAILLACSGFLSCAKEAGEGGNASIRGKIWVREYNSSFTLFKGEHWGMEEDVYIIYGDEMSVGDRVRTNFDGTYEFKYLRPGKYKVYAYSDDSTRTQASEKLVVIREVEVAKNREQVEVPLIVVAR